MSDPETTGPVPSERRTFTLEEAGALLPRVRELTEEAAERLRPVR